LPHAPALIPSLTQPWYPHPSLWGSNPHAPHLLIARRVHPNHVHYLHKQANTRQACGWHKCVLKQRGEVPPHGFAFGLPCSYSMPCRAVPCRAMPCRRAILLWSAVRHHATHWHGPPFQSSTGHPFSQTPSKTNDEAFPVRCATPSSSPCQVLQHDALEGPPNRRAQWEGLADLLSALWPAVALWREKQLVELGAICKIN